MDLSITIRENRGVVILDLSGKLVFGKESDALHAQLKQLLACHKTRIAVNMKNVTTFAYNMGGMLTALAAAREKGGDLRLVSPSGRVQEVLAITHLNTIFPVYATEEEALAGFE